VPRITLTFPALASSRHVLFLVTGAGKRRALARLAAGEALPAGRVTSQGDVAWLLDEAAAG
jgi:6-phosphogluconolactonase